MLIDTGDRENLYELPGVIRGYTTAVVTPSTSSTST